MPCRRRLNPDKSGSKNWYAETCIPYYGLEAATVSTHETIPKPRPCLGRGKLGAATHPTSHRVASSIRRPRLLVEDNSASHPLRESGGRIGDGLPSG